MKAVFGVIGWLWSYEEVKNSIILEEAQKVLQASIEERVQDASVFFVSDKYEQIIVE